MNIVNDETCWPGEKLEEVGKPSQTIFGKKVITSAYFKSSNSSGFNPI